LVLGGACYTTNGDRPATVKTYSFKVVVEPDEGGYHAYCPALRHLGAVTQGATQEEALRNINEVVRMIIDELREDGETLRAASDDIEILDGARVAVTV
jgi:predicted RNase H-like HicB family nuclease